MSDTKFYKVVRKHPTQPATYTSVVVNDRICYGFSRLGLIYSTEHRTEAHPHTGVLVFTDLLDACKFAHAESHGDILVVFTCEVDELAEVTLPDSPYRLWDLPKQIAAISALWTQRPDPEYTDYFGDWPKSTKAFRWCQLLKPIAIFADRPFGKKD